MEMQTVLVAFVLGGLTAVWRFFDGSDKSLARSRSVAHWLFLQSSTPFALVLIAGLFAATNGLQQSLYLNQWPLVFPVLVSGWLLIRGMPGWTEWRPMLIGFAMPTLGASLVYGLLTHLYLALFPFALSGAFVSGTYVMLSRLEIHRSLPGPFTAEKWGRISMGSIVFGLALL